MPTADQHQEQANHNRSFLDAIDRKLYPDWVATAIFYAAVHLVEMLFKQKGDKGGGHRKRNAILRRKYPDIWTDFRPLFDYSILSRYKCIARKPEDIPKLEERLNKLQATIDYLMSS